MKRLFYIVIALCLVTISACKKGKSKVQIKIEQADKYCFGDGVEMDKELARAMYDSLSILEPEVELALGRFYMTDEYGSIGSKIMGNVKFKSAAEDGNTDAMWEYAIYTMSSLKDKEYECVNFLHKAVDENNYIAMYWLARVYEIGFSVEKNEKKAKELYKKSFEGLANIDDKEKTRWENYYLSMLYLNGFGTSKSEKEGKKYLKRSSDAGLPEAQFTLALYYLDEGNAAKLKEAFELFKKAAKQGHLESQIVLEQEYLEGDRLEHSVEKSMFWQMKAAAQGDKTSAELLCVYSSLRFDIAKKYETEIFEVIQINAFRGSAKCQKRLGDFYMHGFGVEQSYEDAYSYYKQAAENGNEDAIEILEKIEVAGNNK